MKSKFGNLNIKDIARGALLAGIAGAGTIIAGTINSGAIPTNAEWILAAKIGGAALLSYLFKNLITNSSDQFAQPEN